MKEFFKFEKKENIMKSFLQNFVKRNLETTKIKEDLKMNNKFYRIHLDNFPEDIDWEACITQCYAPYDNFLYVHDVYPSKRQGVAEYLPRDKDARIQILNQLRGKYATIYDGFALNRERFSDFIVKNGDELQSLKYSNPVLRSAEWSTFYIVNFEKM